LRTGRHWWSLPGISAEDGISKEVFCFLRFLPFCRFPDQTHAESAGVFVCRQPSDLALVPGHSGLARPKGRNFLFPKRSRPISATLRRRKPRFIGPGEHLTGRPSPKGLRHPCGTSRRSFPGTLRPRWRCSKTAALTLPRDPVLGWGTAVGVRSSSFSSPRPPRTNQFQSPRVRVCRIDGPAWICNPFSGEWVEYPASPFFFPSNKNWASSLCCALKKTTMHRRAEQAVSISIAHRQ